MSDSASILDPTMIRTAIDQARQTSIQIGELQTANARTIRTLEAALNQTIKGPSNDPSTLPQSAAEHRRLHRSGFPSRIASDPELEAFIRARIGHRTFAQILSEVAATFPPSRRTSMSALSRWWKVNRQIPDGPT